MRVWVQKICHIFLKLNAGGGRRFSRTLAGNCRCKLAVETFLFQNVTLENVANELDLKEIINTC